MHHLVLDLDAAREHGQFGDGGRLFEINPIVHRHLWLKVRQLDKSIPRLSSELFQFRDALVNRAPRPGLQPIKNKSRKEGGKKAAGGWKWADRQPLSFSFFSRSLLPSFFTGWKPGRDGHLAKA